MNFWETGTVPVQEKATLWQRVFRIRLSLFCAYAILCFAIRMEPIAIMLEAIASRVEAIAMSCFFSYLFSIFLWTRICNSTRQLLQDL